MSHDQAPSPGWGGYPPPGAQPQRYQPPYPAPGGPSYPTGWTTPAPAVAPTNVGAIVLLVVSVVSIVATLVIGLPSGVMAVVALTRNRRDPTGARRLSTWGWVTYAVNAVIGTVLIVAWVVWMRRR